MQSTKLIWLSALFLLFLHWETLFAIVMIEKEISQRFLSLYDPKEARHLARFFKTGVGEYGFGDKFLGVRVPTTRFIVKEYKHSIDMNACAELIKSEWHEIRLSGFLLLIELYKAAKKQNDASLEDEIVKTYMKLIPFGNNWDLVDLVCTHILGDWLISHPEERCILDEFAEMDHSLWHQRVAIVSTLALIKTNRYSDTIRISKRFLSHKHDLIHKATGWMLREMGKRGGYDELIAFLDANVKLMPRTMLRYSIERFPDDIRQYYLKK